MVKKSSRICLLVSIQYMNVMDSQTLHDEIGRAMHSVARQRLVCGQRIQVRKELDCGPHAATSSPPIFTCARRADIRSHMPHVSDKRSSTRR